MEFRLARGITRIRNVTEPPRSSIFMSLFSCVSLEGPQNISAASEQGNRQAGFVSRPKKDEREPGFSTTISAFASGRQNSIDIESGARLLGVVGRLDARRNGFVYLFPGSGAGPS